MDLLRQMMLIRAVETRFLQLHAEGRVKGTVHTCLGQEACAVGVVGALDRERDVIFSSHRAHGHILTYGIPPELLVAEVLGLSGGVCGGIGGTQHLHWRNMYTTGVQGGIAPCAVGAALAEKQKASGAVVAVFLGDGTMGQGVVYESLNVSSLWSLPILFVLEDNKFAQSTPRDMVHAGDISDRARSFGIATLKTDGNDVESVRAVASESIDRVRRASVPVFLVLDTYRLGPHSKGDDSRTEAEIEPHRRNDPITRAAAKLAPDDFSRIEKDVAEDVASVFSRVLAP